MNKSLALLLAVSGLVWANQGQAAEPITFNQYRDGINKIDWQARTISFEKFEKDRLKSDVTVLDLRSEAEYKQGHLKGAKLIGADIKEEKLKELVPNKKTEIIVYCTNTFFPSRRMALNTVCLPQIVALGYNNTYVLEDIWTKSGSDMRSIETLKKSGLWEGETTER
ncbi:hypothetical protein BH11CYA1_BH11CYA1_24680 [soil metagenome]